MLFQLTMGDTKMFETEYCMAIVSDLHWCSRDSKPEVFRRILGQVRADKWVINGDWMERQVCELDPEYPLLELVRQRSRTEKWFLISGNHDPKGLYVGFDLGNIRLTSKLKFTVNKKRFLIVHGHQFDVFLHRWPRAVWALNALYAAVRYSKLPDPLDRWKTFYEARVYNHSIWNGHSDRIAQRALRRGRKEGVDVIIDGHTHKARIDEHKGVMHYNGGSLTENICSMITISHDGTVTMHKFSDQGEYLGVYDLAA